MNVLVHAFQIHPEKGSENSVSWNYVVQMSKVHHLYVIVGITEGDKCGNFGGLEGVSLPNVDFIQIPISPCYELAYKIYDKTFRFLGDGFRYFHFYFWNKDVYKWCKKNTALLSKIDVIHFLSPIGWHEIGYLYELGKPCIWGPVGGFTNCRQEFYRHYTTGKKRIVFKNLSNSFSALFSNHVRIAMKKYNLVIANTIDSRNFIEKHYKTRALAYFPENSMRIIESDIRSEDSIRKKYSFGKDEKINCIWCGSLIDRKMPMMLIDIVKRMIHKNKLKVYIVGGGGLQLSNSIEREELCDVIVLCGSLPREDVKSYFEKSHLHILTSSYEANTTVMFEAMEECVPSIVFDHFGMTDLVKDGITGRKIPVADYEMMCRTFADILDGLCRNPNQLEVLALNLREDSKKYTVDKRIDFFNKCYKFVLNQ